MVKDSQSQIATITAERDTLKDWKEDVLDQMKTTMDEECGKDEKHCTCVPLLRHQVKEMQSSVDLATGMCAAVIAERDEAQEEVQRLRGQVAKIDNLIEQVQMLEERLAALRSAPGMEDVDECFQNYNGNYTRNQICDVPRLESIARQAITSRDEVVGLLKWLKAVAESAGVEFRPRLNRKTDRLLEIVEGK